MQATLTWPQASLQHEVQCALHLGCSIVLVCSRELWLLAEQLHGNSQQTLYHKSQICNMASALDVLSVSVSRRLLVLLLQLSAKSHDLLAFVRSKSIDLFLGHRQNLLN